MMTEAQGKRLMEAFNQYESGTSLATLQGVFPDVAVELNQMVEAERLLKDGKEAMRLDQGMARKIIAALALRAEQERRSLFASPLWRLAAPVGVAALAFMFALAGRHSTQSAPIVGEQALDQDVGALRVAVPMMAKNAEVSLMPVSPEASRGGAVETPEAGSSALVGADGTQASPQTDWLFIWQMAALGLLVIACAVIFFKHKQARRG